MNRHVEFSYDGGPAFPVNDLQSAHATAMAASVHIEDPTERERAYILARAAAVIGMTLRDYFAAKFAHAELVTSGGHEDAADALIAAAGRAGMTVEDRIAHNAYTLADAMLKARSA